jgi:hypothetical protein
MKEVSYHREKTIEYAEKWAYSRNPAYYNFDSLGGDCTNFVSQCIYAGSGTMNYDKVKGWYYKSANDRSPSWTGVEFLYKFLTNNKGIGPYAEKTDENGVNKGDLIQLSFNGETFSHSLLIVDIVDLHATKQIYVATHTYDSYGRSLNSYTYKTLRYIHIQGVRKW